MRPIEAFAAASGFVSVWLAVRNRVANWPIGIVSCVAYALVFAEARLFVSLLLQLLYIVTSIFGWWQWSRRGPAGEVLPVRRLAAAQIALPVGVVLLLTPALGFLLARGSTDPAPYWDAAIGTCALVAMVIMARRYLEHWWFWTATNLLGMGLYAARGLYATVLLWAAYQGLCIAGIVSWKKRLSA